MGIFFCHVKAQCQMIILHTPPGGETGRGSQHPLRPTMCLPGPRTHSERKPKEKKKEHYLLVFILQGDLILAGSLSLGPLHFLSTTGGRSILQAQHLSTAMEMKGQTAISPPYWPSKLCSVITAASHQLCGVRGGSRGKKQVESNVWLWWLGGKDDWIYVPGPIWSDLWLQCRLKESNSGHVTRIKNAFI